MKGLSNIRQAFTASFCFVFMVSAIGAETNDVAIRLRITDALTQVPVSNAIVSLRKPDVEFETLGASTNGAFAFTHPAISQPLELRVDAENYGGVSISLSLTNSRIEHAVHLDRKIPFTGVVIAPTGQTASGAHLALLTKAIRMAIVGLDGKIETFNQLRTSDADIDGQFNIGLDAEAESILVTHELGLGQVPLIGWTNGTKIHLRAWTSAKGRMLVNNAPAANQRIFASMVKFPQALWPVHLQRFETQTDPAGFFSFDRLPPGEVTLLWKQPIGAQSFTSSHGVTFMVDSAFPNELKYYLQGRSIRGEAVAPDEFDWNARFVFAHISAAPQPPSEFSPMGVSAFPSHFGAKLSEKGKFEAIAVPPGKYKLRIQAHKEDNTMEVIEGLVVVPEGAGPIDLGRVTLKKMTQ